MEPESKGELIVFRKGTAGVWTDTGEQPSDDEAAPERPRPSLLMLPVLLFLDALALVIALACRPIAATVLIAGTALVWAVVRGGLGLGREATVGLLLVAWLAGHLVGYDIDRLVKQIEAAESAVLRGAYRRHRVLGRAVHILFYLYHAAAPCLVLALLSGLWRGPAWLPSVLQSDSFIGVDHPVLVLLAGATLGLAAVLTRYRWHPVARHATLTGRPRRFAVIG